MEKLVDQRWSGDLLLQKEKNALSTPAIFTPSHAAIYQKSQLDHPAESAIYTADRCKQSSPHPCNQNSQMSSRYSKLGEIPSTVIIVQPTASEQGVANDSSVASPHYTHLAQSRGVSPSESH